MKSLLHHHQRNLLKFDFNVFLQFSNVLLPLQLSAKSTDVYLIFDLLPTYLLSFYQMFMQLYRIMQLTARCVFNMIGSGGQVTFKKQLSYFTSVTCKSNSLLLIRYPFFIVTVPLQLLVTDILNVTKQLLVTTKSNQLRGGTVTSLL